MKMRKEWWYVVALVIIILIFVLMIFRDETGLAPSKSAKVSYSLEDAIPKLRVETGPQVPPVNLEDTIKKTFNLRDATSEQKSSVDELENILFSAGWVR